MIFSSYEFIFLFLPITFGIYFYLNKKNLINLAILFLAIASLFFYSWWNIYYLPLILISVITNYCIGQFLIKKVAKKNLLILGIVFNLSLLGYFKYSDFFIQNINALLNSNYSFLNLTLPLAIPFFTYTLILLPLRRHFRINYRKSPRISLQNNIAIFLESMKMNFFSHHLQHYK